MPTMSDLYTAMFLQAASAALAAAGLMLVLVPATVPHSRVVRGAGLAALLLAAGGLARATFASLGGEGAAASAAFRLGHVAWCAGAAVTPVLVRGLLGSRGLVPAVAAPIGAGLLAAFAWTPAFLAGPWDGTDLSGLGIRWAFIATAALTVAASGYSAARLSVLLVVGVDRTTRGLALGIALPSLALCVVPAVVAGADAGVFPGARADAIAGAVPLVWLLAAAALLRHTLGRQEILVRHMRQDLDNQAASSIRDVLTGLFNRGYFAEALRQTVEQARRNVEPFALCLIDLDDFKAINDTHGHPAGDAVLRAAAHTVMRACRPYDTAARYGGEEFVVILRGVDEKQSMMVAERMRAAVEAQEVAFGKARLRITATVGVVAAGVPPAPADEMIRRADEAMYQGKHQGKNRVRAG
ncbi:MAG: GGDEF domain-containing protein [Deltaproteobacteria bacterium]|nr:GGDEF domain-containing protein [Deltaproteobacteria bacterium]